MQAALIVSNKSNFPVTFQVDKKVLYSYGFSFFFSFFFFIILFLVSQRGLLVYGQPPQLAIFFFSFSIFWCAWALKFQTVGQSEVAMWYTLAVSLFFFVVYTRCILVWLEMHHVCVNMHPLQCVQ